MNEIKIMVAMAAAFLLGIVGVWVFQSKMESSAFNSVTGKTVTTWQAMWIELRVQEQSK